MSPLKLLFFVGVSVAMMVSVHGIIDHNDDARLPSFQKDQIMHDEDVSEDNEENATLFDEAATTFSPEEDWSDDVAFDEDINEDSTNHVDSQEFNDRIAALIAEIFKTDMKPPSDEVAFDEDVNEDYAKDAVIFDEPSVTYPPPDLLHDIVYDEDINEDYGKDAIIFDEPVVEPMSSEKHVDSPGFFKHLEDLFTMIYGPGMYAHPRPTQPNQPKDQENNKA